MKKGLLLYAVGVLLPLFAHSQAWEIGGMIGGSNYSGDLSPGPVVFSETGIAAGAIVRYNVNKFFTVKANAYYGSISGSDRNATTEKNRIRNLSFWSTILDVGANAELNLTGFQNGNRKYRTSPYLFTGLSVFQFNPEAKYQGNWVRLQPLGTEGQGTIRYNDREKYALTQVAIPIGVGLKHNFSGNWNVGLEFGMRKTFTDYLDDVSNTYVENDYLAAASGSLAAALSNRSGEMGQPHNFTSKDLRGNPTNKDWYMFGGIIISYTIRPPMCYRF